ncbi:MAG: histidine kinase [Burkholderiales bacterium]|jgi:two-component system sensor histidine kinase AlgZ|nr:histidine kinase [Burkholderiales bacterium]
MHQPLPAPLLPDACNAGTAIRAYILVNAVVLLLALAAGPRPEQWWGPLLQGVAVAEPAAAIWLSFMCLSRRSWRRLGTLWRLAVGIVAGAASGWLAQALVGSVLILGEGGGLPDWRSALVGAALATVFLHYLGLRAQALTPATVQARLDELQARIRPHFLFNALNAASALVREQPQQAEQVLDDLAELFRATVSRPGTLSTVAEEVDLARRYLGIEAVRFGDRMQVHWAVEPGLEGLRIPALTLQPLVENAVRHGVESCAGPCLIDVWVTPRAGMLEIGVVNDYVPREGQSGNGTRVALSNITQRLRLLYDITADLRHGRVDGLDPARYRVRIRLPL